jgi:hypothetical protein
LKRPGLRERIPLDDQDNAVGRIPAAVAIPAELQSFSESHLPPDESFRDFEFMRNAIVCEVRPESFIEWLWTFDLVELSWEILRYRRFKMRLLDAYRATAIESLLLLLDSEGLPDEAAPMVRVHAREARADWRNDPKAAAEIEARLARSGFDQSDISTEAFMQARELFLMLDQLMHSAQSRRNSLLREIGVRPRFAKCACHLRLDQCR